MRLSLKNYIDGFKNILLTLEASDLSVRKIDINEAIEKVISEISKKRNKDSKVIIVGNGGSASIANHMAVDLWKNAGIKAISFSDSALLTCVSNDFGYSEVFAKPIEMFTKTRDILIAISSSGKSENILRAVDAAKRKKCRVITMSGFNRNNALKNLGELNFYVSSNSYGYIELAHSILCHFIVDKIMYKKSHG